MHDIEDPCVPNAMVAHLLTEFTWSRNDVLQAMCCSASLFNSTARNELPYIPLTSEIREKYSAFLSELSPAARCGQFLYNPADVASWLRRNLRSTVTTVLVPLTLFCRNPDAMRDAFLRLKKTRVSNAYADDKSGRRSRGQLCFWPEMQNLVCPEFRNEVWAFPEDVARAAIEQNRKTDKIVLPAFEVTLPEGVIPKFFDAVQVAATRKSSSRTAGRSIIRNFAWARHAFPIGIGEPQTAGLGKVLYTQGLFFGNSPAFLDDYDNGLLTVMTAERYVRLFGESALKEAGWRFSKDLVSWCGQKGFSFGPGLPPPELSKLLLFNQLRRRHVQKSEQTEGFLA